MPAAQEVNAWPGSRGEYVMTRRSAEYKKGVSCWHHPSKTFLQCTKTGCRGARIGGKHIRNAKVLLLRSPERRTSGLLLWMRHGFGGVFSASIAALCAPNLYRSRDFVNYGVPFLMGSGSYTGPSFLVDENKCNGL